MSTLKEIEEINNPDTRKGFMVIIDCIDGSLNGDPDGDGQRVDDDGYGMLTDVALKRWIRDAAVITDDVDLFCESVVSRESKLIKAGGESDKKADTNKNGKALQTYWDVRLFGGGVGLTGTHPQRGSIQFGMGSTIHEIEKIETAITCSSHLDSDSEGQVRGAESMGVKRTVPYSVFVITGSYSPSASAATSEDLDILFRALATVGEARRSASAPNVKVRHAYVFDHGNSLGVGYDDDLFSAVNIVSNENPKSWDDIKITVNTEVLHEKVSLVDVAQLIFGHSPAIIQRGS